MSSLRPLLLSVVLLPALIMSLGCATTHHNPNIKLIEESDYQSTMDKYTQRKQVYDGFYATMEFSAVLVNTVVARGRVDQNARIYQWDTNKYADEKSKAESSLAKQTEIFLSFYVPDRKNDDLNKSKTLWKIFLDAGGKRYEGKVEKIKTLMAEVMALYPSYNRWCTPYKLTFNIPTAQVENGPLKLTLTGPVGSAAVEFPPLELN